MIMPKVTRLGLLFIAKFCEEGTVDAPPVELCIEDIWRGEIRSAGTGRE